MDQYAHRIIVGIVLCCLTGCGSDKAVLSGKVSYNGATLNKPGGIIILVGTNGEQLKADIDPNGEYTMSGVPFGHYRVVVYYPSQVIPTGKSLPKKRETLEASAPSPFLTPIKYSAAETSGLEVEVQPGTIYNVAMEGPPIP
jgi:hypothetical protein